MRPTEDRILILPDHAKDNIAGFKMLDKEKEKPQIGTVIRVGPGKINHNIKLNISGEATPELLDKISQLLKPVSVGLKEGGRVMFGRYSGTRVKHQGKEVLFIRESDVLSILEEGDEGYLPA